MAFSAWDLLEESTLTMDTSGELRPAKTVRKVDFVDTQYLRISYDGIVPEYTALQVGIEYSTDAGETWGPLIEPGPALESGNTAPVLSNWNEVYTLTNGVGDLLIRLVITGAADIQFTLYYVQVHFR